MDQPQLHLFIIRSKYSAFHRFNPLFARWDGNVWMPCGPTLRLRLAGNSPQTNRVKIRPGSLFSPLTDALGMLSKSFAYLSLLMIWKSYRDSDPILTLFLVSTLLWSTFLLLFCFLVPWTDKSGYLYYLNRISSPLWLTLVCFQPAAL